jgi:hypothetical protein
MPSIIIPLTESTPKCVPEEHYNVTTGHIKGIRALRAKKIKTEIKALVLTTNSALCVLSGRPSYNKMPGHFARGNVI